MHPTLEQASLGDVNPLTILQSNKASLYGGATFRTQSKGNITYCTFDDNDAKKFGGGIYDTQVRFCNSRQQDACLMKHL